MQVLGLNKRLLKVSSNPNVWVLWFSSLSSPAPIPFPFPVPSEPCPCLPPAAHPRHPAAMKMKYLSQEKEKGCALAGQRRATSSVPAGFSGTEQGQGGHPGLGGPGATQPSGLSLQPDWENSSQQSREGFIIPARIWESETGSTMSSPSPG